jgi:hypothetical protein
MQMKKKKKNKKNAVATAVLLHNMNRVNSVMHVIKIYWKFIPYPLYSFSKFEKTIYLMGNLLTN